MRIPLPSVITGWGPEPGISVPPELVPVVGPLRDGLRSVLRSLVRLRDYLEASSIIADGVAWTPGTIANGAIASTTVTMRQAQLGMPCTVAFSLALAAGVILAAQVTSAEVVTVTLLNQSGGAVTPGAGTLRIDVWR